MILRIAIAAAAAALLAGSILSATGAAGHAHGGLAVTFDEWQIQADGSVPAGRIALSERNAGAQEHELVLVRTDRAADDLPVGLEGVAPELAGDVVLGEAHDGHAHGGGGHGATHLQPGAERRRVIALEPGHYVALCPIPGHYERGQRTAFTVR